MNQNESKKYMAPIKCYSLETFLDVNNQFGSTQKYSRSRSTFLVLISPFSLSFSLSFSFCVLVGKDISSSEVDEINNHREKKQVFLEGAKAEEIWKITNLRKPSEKNLIEEMFELKPPLHRLCRKDRLRGSFV